MAFDFDAAAAAHADWKSKLRSAIIKKETLDASTISKDNCCVLGKWLHGEGRSKHSTSAGFSDLIAKHQEFHKEAGAVAAKINAKAYDEAEKMLAGATPYGRASTAVGVALLMVKKSAGKA